MLKFLWNLIIMSEWRLKEVLTSLTLLQTSENYLLVSVYPCLFDSYSWEKKANKFIISSGIKSVFATCTIDTISPNQSFIPLNFTRPFEFTASYWMLKYKACWANYIIFYWTAPLNTTTFPCANKEVIFTVSTLSNPVLLSVLQRIWSSLASKLNDIWNAMPLTFGSESKVGFGNSIKIQ